MNAQAEVERIRARVADEYWQATEGARHDLGTFSDLALADLRTLLAHLDAQQAVIEAAGEVVSDVTAANWYEDAFTYVVDAEKLETLKREYDALADARG